MSCNTLLLPMSALAAGVVAVGVVSSEARENLPDMTCSRLRI